VRLIPARAETTAYPQPTWLWTSAHPRVCGAPFSESIANQIRLKTFLMNQEHHPIRLHLLVGLSFRQ
jgi:hypothetical protein